MSEDNNKKKNQGQEDNSEEFLKKYLEETDVTKSSQSDNEVFANNVKSDSRATDLQFFSFPAEDMPLGIFYPKGTTIMVRAAQVKEIQSYSMVDDQNFYDIVEKMNDMLGACVRVKYPDGRMGTYLDVKDGDRYYLIFLIRELTFQKGSMLSVKAKCDCGEKVEIPMTRNHFEFYEMDEQLEPFFDKNKRVFVLETINGDIFELGVPNIGLQKSFTEKIVEDYKKKENPNMSFLKIIPFTLSHLNKVEDKFINKKLFEFQSLDDNSFQFLNAAVNKMQFGIEKLKMNCEKCGLEVRTDFTFPGGASAIFVVHDAFEKFIKK
jgi:hypothetical protein